MDQGFILFCLFILFYFYIISILIRRYWDVVKFEKEKKQLKNMKCKIFTSKPRMCEKNINDWLREQEKIKIVSITQSYEDIHDMIIITVFYNESKTKSKKKETI